MFQRLFLLVICLASFPVSADRLINEFKTGSYQQILQQQQENSFLMVFWSLDCPPCYKELAMLADELKQQPKLDLVLISTDTTEDINEIQQKLNKFGFGQVNAWVFHSDIAQQLRYEIDPDWYGELPRSYLFDAQHNRQPISGILKPVVLQRWASLQTVN